MYRSWSKNRGRAAFTDAHSGRAVRAVNVIPLVTWQMRYTVYRISRRAKRNGHYDDYVTHAIFVICYSAHQSRAEDRRGGSRRHRSRLRRDQSVSTGIYVFDILISYDDLILND